MFDTFTSLFLTAVKAHPDKSALCHLGNTMSYAALFRESGRVAQKLKTAGVGKGDIVTILMERGIPAVCAMLGVLGAGAAFCFISRDYPEERIRFIEKDTTSKVTVDNAWMKDLPEDAAEFVIPHEKDPAVAVYTSGSTGNPKGVLNSHLALSIALHGNVYSRTEDDIFMSVAAFSFIAVAIDVLTPLALGATLHILPDDVRRDAARIEQYIHANSITTGFLPPQIARIVLPKVEDQLLSLVVGSDRVYGLYSDRVTIHNSYGASETCGPLCTFTLDRMYPDITPIGKAYEGNRIYILDDELNALPIGTEGEICVSGQIADGYINLPELTAERFVANPFSENEYDRILFRTGDIGKLDENGDLHYVQRKDWMIKVRGFRVEPGEIEQTIMKHAPVDQAVVTGYENASGDMSLYAVYTAKEAVSPSVILDAIRDYLPPYMMPAFIEQWEKLPLNQNGKVARREITPPDAARFAAPYEVPETEAEARICDAFAKVFGLARVGVLDDFNLLGGDSILAARLQTELDGFSASDILSLGTPRALAALDISAPFTKAEPREEYPLTFAERQMAIEQGLNPDSVTYNVNLAFRIEGALDIPALQNALDALILRHQVLRSYYPLVNGEYIHKLRDSLSVPVVCLDCAEQEVEAKIQSLNRPFDLENDPLIRCHLMRHESAYTLHFSIHHIIIDAGSSDAFVQDLFDLYAGKELPPLSFDYLDHAVWQSENTDLRTGEAVFSEMFAGGAPENEMPTHASRPAVLPIADIDLEAKIPAALLGKTADALGVTRYGLLVSVLGMTLAKYCGTEDVVIGTAMSGRTRPEQENMMGMFVNTLPIRLKPASDMRVAEYAVKTARTIRTVKAHQTYPFERLVPVLAPDRNASRSPVFDVIFNYLQEIELPSVEGLTVSRLPIKGQALNMDLMLEAIHEGEDLRLVLSYSRALYLDEVAENFLEQFVTTLNRIADNANITVEEASELPEKQRNQILHDFAGFRTDENLGRTVVELFREQAKKTPDARASVFGEETLTYAELDDITDRLAAHLAKEGIGRGNVVAILVKRGLMMPVGAIGVLKSGAAYLPLDASYPTERLEFMIEDAGADTVIGESALMEKIPSFGGRFMPASDVFTLPKGEAPKGPRPEDLFILLYTSGTTGKPKSVMLLHENLVNYITFYKREHGLSEKDNVPAYASFGFDAHMMDLYPTLTSGACLHIIPEEMRLDLPGLKEYFDKNEITVAFMTTQLGRQFADSMTCRSMRALSVGGEALVPIAPPDFPLYNIYGPTECTIASNGFRVDKLYDRVPIGRAFDNTAVYVVDPRGKLCPVGVAGELYITGRQVAKGYLNRPDLTEEKFIRNPFSEEADYARAYKTGDIVRFLPTGDIDFVGRRDFQVKIRGFRVELTEIENRIRAYPAITDATVIAVEDAGGGKRVVAYIVSDEPVEISAMNAFIEEELPAYMVPSATMQIDRIPLNQNGKVDRRRLPKITIQAEETVAPRTEMERVIVEVVADILAVESVGVTTDLMYAGLNSLSAIKAAARITEKTGKKLTTAELMRLRTAEKIALLLEEGESYIARVFEKKAAYPLTANQLGLYFACIKDPASLVYNIPMALTAENIDAERLLQSVTAVIHAHSYIKTHFAMQGGEPVSLRLDDEPVTIPLTDCTEEEYEIKKSGFVRPFNFFEGPLYRIEICRTEKAVHMLADFHHIVFDGGSMDIFLRDLSRVYNGEALTPERFTSFDLALLESEEKDSDAAEKAAAFYRERLAASDGATVIPTDGEGTGIPKTVYAYVQKNKVEAPIKGMRITASNLFLSATALVMGRFASTREIRLASITNGREGAQRQDNLGMLVKTLPVTVRPTAAMTAENYLSHVQAEMNGVMENLSYTYMQASSDYGFNAQLLFAYQGGVVSEYALCGAPMQMEPLGLDRVKFPISVNVGENEESYIIEAEYEEGLFKDDTMRRFADCIASMAEKLSTSADTKIDDMSILTEEQKAKIASFNQPIIPIRTRSLNLMFEACAKKTPNATALVACDGTFTYKELNERANRLAHSLIERGVTREDRVAFMLHRDSRILVSMLGIMKAGGCYIPVDPDYPDDRIAHVLEDSGARFILTDGTREVEGGILIDPLLENEKTEDPALMIHPDDLAYIIYTSGSTGKPKGVMLTHRGIVNYVTDMGENRHVRALTENHCIMASVTTVSFDMFLKEVFTTLMNGLTLVLADDEEAKNPDKLASLMLRTGATAFNATPSRMLQYMQLPEMQKALAGCRVIMAGGEGYPPMLYQKLRAVTDAVLINTYGPTEITVSSNGKLLDSERVTIGAPLQNVLELVMDVAGNPLPVGVTGELWIGGTGVARGYFGNPEMTAERFIEKYGVRWYRSGDLARFTENGEIMILGRNDGQIKLRGLRIELGEIESAIGEIPEITGGVVLVKKINGHEHLCAYYTATRLIPAEEMRDILMTSLTKYMVPTAFLQMDTFPMTPNGKIDRRALPEAKLMQRDVYEAPVGEMEEAYCAIFAEVLSLEKVGATDNFFDLGGTSLLVTQVTIAGAERGFAISYGDVFTNPTPRALAKLGTESDEPQKIDEIAEYDYTAIHALLQENTIDALRIGECRELGNICITGATGFLGIHVLHEYLRSEKGTAYCVIRGGRQPAEKRLKNMLVYYFSDSFDALFGNRIVVVEGDITSEKMFETLKKYPIDTYINCAANVKHFSAGTDIEDINVGGVINGVAFAKEVGCRFVQISTASIAGMSIDHVPDEATRLTEQMFYFGQDLSNKYTRSKFLAERTVLEAALDGLDAKIMRVGNLMARDSDGEFQVNFKTNNFLGRLKAYHIIGKIPYEAMGGGCEFAPIDCTARAVLLLSKTPKACRVFHPYNDHDIFMGDVVRTLDACGIAITPVEKEDYDRAFSEAFLDGTKAEHLRSLIAYQEYGKVVLPIKSVNTYTSQALLRQDFLWPITTPAYLKNFFDTVGGLGFFDTWED